MLHTTPPSSGVRLVAAQRQAAACLLLFRQPHFGGHNRRPDNVPRATRDTSFAYQQDIQTKLKPGDFADRMDNKPRRLADAPDWQTVLRLFAELGDNSDRNIGLVGDMLVSLQRLLPAGAAGAGAGGAAGAAAGRLSPQDAKQLALGLSSMCEVLLDNITRVNNKLLTNVVWALALLPDPSKALASPAAAAARARAVGGLGAAVITRIPKLTAEEVFHVCAGLALLGFKPPRTLTRQVQQRPADGSAAASSGSSSSSSSMSFGALLERRSIKVMHYMSPKSIADAGFVMSRLVAPGDVSAEWLGLYAKISKQHLDSMQPEALIYAGYAFARHSHAPSNSWQKSYLRALQGLAKSLAGEEFPLALFTLARWKQQNAARGQQQQQAGGGGYAAADDYDDDDGFDDEEEEYEDQWSAGASSGSSSSSSGTGTAAPQALIDDLLFASHSNRALRELPLSQLVVMVKALAELQATVSPMWMQRLWPLINTKIDAAVAAESSSSSSSSAAGSLTADLMALLTAIPRLQPVPQLPADFLDGLVGNLGLGLAQIRSRNLAAIWAALQQLDHQPDAIFERQLQTVLLAAVPAAASSELPALLQLGLAVASSGSSSSSVQGWLAPEAFCEQLLQAVVDEVSRRVDLAAGADAAKGAAAAQQRQQLLADAAANGLWQLPQGLATCVQHLHSSSSEAPVPAVAAVMQRYLPQLRQLYVSVAVSLATVMPTDPLLSLLGSVLDMPADQEQQLGLSSSSSSSSKQGVISAILQAGVYQQLPGAGVTSDATSVTSVTRRNILENFGVPDFMELFVVIADARLQQQVPHALLDAAAEALHGALAPKGPAYGFPASPEWAADLVSELVGYGYELPTKLKTRYKKWLGPEGLTEKMEKLLAAKKKASSSSSRGSSKKAAAAAPSSSRCGSGTAVKAAAAVPAAVPAAAPVVDAGGVVRSSRSRVTG